MKEQFQKSSNSSIYLNNILNTIFESQLSIFQRFRKFSEFLNLQIIEPLSLFQKNYEKNIDTLLNNIKDFENKISEQKNIVINNGQGVNSQNYQNQIK